LFFLLASAGCAEDTAEEMVELETSDGHRFRIDIYEYPNQQGREPMHTMDLEGAKEACSKEGKRLCTATEWRRACAGSEGLRRYAYGSAYIPRICHTQVDLPSGHSSMLDASDLVASSGAYRDCQTDEGVYDLNGNLEEWVLDSWRGVGGMLEGGAFYTHQEYTDCTGRYSRQPDYRLVANQPVFSAGFRCCLSETPPTEADIASDADQRLEKARSLSSSASYQSDDEVEIRPGVFMDRFEYPNRAGEYPLRALNWEDASERCSKADKRLCGAAEWERACSGSLRSLLPYGDDYMAGACPVYLSSPTPSGSHPACASEAGVYDLVGGLWEWTNTPLDAEALRSQPDESLREIRGGSWYVEERKGVCRPEDGYPAAPEGVPFPDVGFRCCRGETQQPTSSTPTVKNGCAAGLLAVGDSCVSILEFPGKQGLHPRGNLDWQGAIEACSSQGLRVCSESEWERACEGSERRRWPYGDVFDPEACFLLSSPRDAGEVNARPSGSLTRCRTPEGIMDLSGNLWEWTRAEDGSGVLRGGGWDFSAGLGQCRSRAPAEGNYSEPQLGVRCCGEIKAPAVLETPVPSPDSPPSDGQ
jgi:formylglycine-generating enzyme required for sulfatase activity